MAFHLPLFSIAFILIFVFNRFAIAYERGVNWEAYEKGELGLYPQVKYQSVQDIHSPLIHVTKSNPKCDNTSFTLLSPNGEGIPGNLALLVDSQGELVWFRKELGAVNNLRVQTYKGKDYITYWVGDDTFMSHGRGYYKMLDQTYTLTYTVSALDGADGDFHEFSITQDNTALITAYVKRAHHLSQFGRRNGYIWDCVFQEIDLDTDQILFEWRAADHFSFEDMAVNTWEDWMGTDMHPWDWFHLNSVEKDLQGNFLISARGTSAISYIDGKTGSPLWHLGGQNDTFTDSFRTGSTRIIDPHMASWVDNYTAITVFHNAGIDPDSEQPRKQSYGLKINLDTDRWLSHVEKELIHSERLPDLPEGSIDILENGNYFLGYGPASIYSEFSPSGTLLCNTHYAPLHASHDGSLKAGFVTSYRVYKHNWTGRPKEPARVFFEDGSMHISWNGATELQKWKVEATEAFEGSSTNWAKIGTYEKGGFETSIALDDDYYTTYRITALDSSSKNLRSWVIHSEGDIWEIFPDGFGFRKPSSQMLGVLVVIICASLLLFFNRRYIFGMYSRVKGHRQPRAYSGFYYDK